MFKEQGREIKTNKMIFRRFTVALFFLGVGCADSSSSKGVISYDPFTSNCNVSYADIVKNCTKVLVGYPAGYEKLIEGGNIGFVVDEEKEEILSTLSVIYFQEIDIEKLNGFFDENGVFPIGGHLEGISEYSHFCVMNMKTKRIFICYLRFFENKYELVITYDCIKD
jgi:hypothetical protein